MLVRVFDVSTLGLPMNIVHLLPLAAQVKPLEHLSFEINDEQISDINVMPPNGIKQDKRL